jgi:hypothetical protein
MGNKIIKITSGESENRKTTSLAILESRDSKSIIHKWKSKVTDAEISLIQDCCGDLLNILYPEPYLMSLQLGQE